MGRASGGGSRTGSGTWSRQRRRPGSSAAQQVTPHPPADAALVARGKDYYSKICFRCHGEMGMGSAQYARIAGQQPEYLFITLKRYRDGSATRMDPIMAANTRNMTDADLKAVVAYVSTMK